MRALVLAGGGVAGIAWELGVLLGLRDGAPDLLPALVDADVVVGTSAGAAVGAQITSGVDLEELYAAQLDPASSEIEVDLDAEALAASYEVAARGATSAVDARRRFGELALVARTVSEADRRTAIEARLPSLDWPDRRLLITAIDTATGELEIFTPQGLTSLTDAVAASCAVPGVWPPVTIGGRRYMDGGMRSGTNVDLVAGCDRILVLSPTLPGAPSLLGDLDADVVPPADAQVLVVPANVRSMAAFGRNPLSPATRAPSAEAGRAVGRARAARVAEFWT
ncbi:patatin-like phospholipase family protein [Allobranchiibius sp. GilTou73]|uniref:patatin-like phospholipase family protein n=1 Tax=Allobranchiibius sp. GilTou73 TaxID=2904523 RepID=UPI001F1A877C|nr:patatin-like phospholipase family protein [Allobranchiibius sp. GilTou73]UIJ33689.1 patatin-like phospholipase family protein [Allobranchiibius sp. GilTou73]